MEHHKLTVSKTAQFYQIGETGPNVRQIWIVCHGYAQLATEFIKNFEIVNTGDVVIVAPEGLNHFYKKGFNGDVGATWMTRHCREDEIADNGAYLEALHNRYLALLPKHVRIILLGFSQGTATVCRWILRYHPHFHDLVLWAGMPPEDLDYQAHKDYLADKNLYLLYGSNDPFLTPDRFSELKEIEQTGGIDFDENRFEGGHEIPNAALQNLLKKLN
ncbi:MAG: phospholipase [Lewinellaceae bacterium]|nr:hypothetical protein [Saprospiraceae bacterium]MCB9330416.1 phospholipase [Lewinellaceae bacterium]